jgi:hypothetical protein
MAKKPNRLNIRAHGKRNLRLRHSKKSDGFVFRKEPPNPHVASSAPSRSIVAVPPPLDDVSPPVGLLAYTLLPSPAPPLHLVDPSVAFFL